MDDTIKKHDWFATLMFNPDLSTSDLKDLDITADNSSLKSREDYKNIAEVKQRFTDANGKFNEKQFNSFYDGALELFNNSANGEYEKRLPILFGYLDSKWDRDLNENTLDTDTKFIIKQNKELDPNAVYYMPGSRTQTKYTPKELAEMEEVVDYKTGKGLGWTPEDKGGLLEGIVRPTLVLAAYDEDGVHEENGRIVEHKKGDLKYNKNGNPYAETLGDRDIRGKQVISYWDTITREDSAWNKFDFFDSDGYDQSFLQTVVKTAAFALPYFIPGVNTFAGGITAALGLARVLPVIGKAVNGITGGSEDNDFGKSMNQFEGVMSRFDPTVSLASQEHLVTVENLGNLVSSISGQLFQQRAVGMIPALLKSGKPTAETAKLGRNLAFGYMAVTSAQDAYNTFKEAGATDMVAGLGTVANMLAIWKLMHIDYFRDNLFKGTYMDESELRAPAFKVAKEFRTKISEGASEFVKEGEKIATKKGAARFVNKLSNWYADKMLPSMAEGNLLTRMFSEATEEVMEEGVADMTKGITAALNTLGIKVTEEGKELDFGFTLEDIASRYGMAFAGGFIGGGIFAGQDKFERWLLHENIKNTEQDDIKKLIYYIAEGRADDIKGYYTKWYKQGLLGSRDLGTSLTAIESIDGRKIVAEPANGNQSQNDVVYRHLMNQIDFLQNLINSEGLGMSRTQLDNLRKSGFNVSDQTLKAQTLIDLGAYSTLEDDLLTLAAKIIKKNDEIQSKIDEIGYPGDTSPSKEDFNQKIKNNGEIQKLKEELDELRKQREDILSGKLNYRYALQSLFITNPVLSGNFTGEISKDAYTRMKYNISYDNMSDDQKATIDSEFDDFRKTTGKERIIKAADLYYALSTTWGAKLAEAASKLQGFSSDTIHKAVNIGIIEYQRIQKEFTRLETEVAELRKKESLTNEETKKLGENIQSLVDLQRRLESLQEAPGRLLSLATEDNSAFKAIEEKLLTGQLDDTGLAELSDLIKKMYLEVSSKKMVLSGDSELHVLYDEVRNRFNSGGDIARRMLLYFEALGNKAYKEEVDNDLAEGAVWERESSRVNTDYDIWFADSSDEETELRTYVKENLETFVDKFGRNNQAAIQAYNNVLNALHTRTNLSEQEIKEFLSIVIPTLNGKSIVDFMQEMDSIRANVTYSPIASLLKELWPDFAGNNSSVIDLIESEEKRLSTSTLTGYTIDSEEVKKTIVSAKSALDALSALLIGATDKTNATVNAFKENPISLPVIEDNNAAIILANDIDVIKNRLNYLLLRSEHNSMQALKTHERIDKNMRSKILTAVTSPAFVDSFKKKFKYNENGVEKEIDLKSILDEVTPTNFSFDAIDVIDANVLQSVWAKFGQRVYEEVSKTDFFKNDSILAENLVSLFDKNIWKLNPGTLSDKQDEVIAPIDLLTYLMTTLSVPSNAMLTQYSKATMSDKFKFAPVFGQEYAALSAVAYIARPNLFNSALNEIKQIADTEVFDQISDEHVKTYLKNLSLLKNFYMVPGGAGTGKTSGVAATVAAMFEDHAKAQFIALAPKEQQAINLKNELGDKATYLVKNSFMKAIRGEEPSAYRDNTDTGHIVRSAPSTYTTNIFDASNEIKVLVIDEVGLFTESELKEISDWAILNGVLVIGLGDPKQITPTVQIAQAIQRAQDGSLNVVDVNKKAITGLEDCMYFSSPMLTASLRNANLGKKENFVTLDSILYDVWRKYSENRAWNTTILDNLIPETIDLVYCDENGLYGEKIVGNDTNLIEEAQKFKGSGTTAIIYDETNADKYNALEKDGNIEFIPYDEMQGREWTHILVDVDFSAKSPSKFMRLKHLYTVSQRSREGSIIKEDKLSEIAIINNGASDSKMKQQITVTPNQINSFKQYRNNALKTIPNDNSFFDYFTTVITPIPIGKTNNPIQQAPTNTHQVNNPTNIPIKPGTIIIDTKEYNRFLNHSSFESWELSQDSLAKKLGLAHLSDLDDSNYSGVYKNIVETIGSIVRKNGEIKSSNNIFDELEPKIGFTKTAELKTYLTGNRSLQVVPYHGKYKLLVSRFGDNVNHIDVPICIIQTNFIGQYNGTINRRTELKLNFSTDGKYNTIREFLAANPGLHVFSKAGVLICDESTAKQIENDPTLSPGAKKFLTITNSNGKTNNGKLFIILTDEISDLSDYNDVWVHPKDGNLISHYNQVRLAGVHKPLQLSEIIAYVTAISQGKSGQAMNISSLIANGLWDDTSNPVEVIKSVDWAALPAQNTPEFHRALYGRKWQIVPTDRSQELSAILLNTASQDRAFKEITDDLVCFLNTYVEPSQKIEWETHGIVLANGNKAIYVTPKWNGDKLTGYELFDYSTRTRSIIWSSRKSISFTGTDFPYKSLCDTYLNGDATKIELKRFVKYRNQSQTLVDISANDQLFILLNTLSKSSYKVDRLNEILQKTPNFVNSVYMDDMAKSDNNSRLKGSRFFAEFEGDFMDYVIGVESVEYSTYTINESLISSTQNNTNTSIDPMTVKFNQYKTEINKLLKFLSDNHINAVAPDENVARSYLNTKSVDELITAVLNGINGKYKFSPNNWVSTTVIRNQDGSYSIQKIDDFNGWLIQKTKDIGTNVNILDNYLKTKNYATFTLDTAEGTKTMIVRNIKGSYEVSEFNSYETFKPILELAKNNQQLFGEIQNYIHSLVYDYGSTNTDYASIAFDWLINNRNIPEVEQMFKLINEHLINRLDNNEC